MTTAHRPTFDTARGGMGKNEGDLSKLSKQYSSKDMPSHTKIKYRQTGQATTDELKGRDFRRELEDRERSSRKSSRHTDSSSSSKRSRLEITSGGETSKNPDADDPLEDDDVDDEDDDSDDEDDTAELMAELSRIKKERAAEKAKQEAERAVDEERIRTENILHGNPLLNGDKDKADFKVARRWDDDVVFKNCAKGLDERVPDPTFINDSIRGEFHKKFMERYIK